VPAFYTKALLRIDPVGDIEHARLAWMRGDYHAAIARLHGRRDPKSCILLAHSHLRLRDARAAFDALQAESERDSNESNMIALLRASAAERLGRHDVNYPSLPPRANRDVRATFAFYGALSLWIRRDVDAAFAGIRRAIDFGDTPILADAIELRAWIELRRGNNAAAVRSFLETLDILALRSEPDEGLRASVLSGLAMLAARTNDGSFLARVHQERETLVPVAGIARPIVSMLIWLSATREKNAVDDTEAFELLLEARAIGASEPLSVYVDIALARFHRRRGSLDASKRHVELAQQRIDRTDWSSAGVDARSLLLTFAAEASELQPDLAGSAFTKALSLTGRRDPILAFDGDRRMLALALTARGRIAASRERTREAVADLQRAYKLYLDLEFHHDAVVTALYLARLSRTLDPASEALLQQTVRDFPDSLLASEIRSILTSRSSPFAKITVAERRVLERICEGKTSRQIAAELERSPSTVRNQTITMFRTLGVKTRAGLVALVAAESRAGNPFLVRHSPPDPGLGKT
jgi:DNA-binding NarL/FixJ family response regulator